MVDIIMISCIYGDHVSGSRRWSAADTAGGTTLALIMFRLGILHFKYLLCKKLAVAELRGTFVQIL